jgi:hypothetical protein
MTSKPVFSFLLAAILAVAGDAAVGAGPACGLPGNPAPAQAAPDEVIVITDATRYVNVTSGDTVRFVVGRRAFSWRFEPGAANVEPFDLRRIAPHGVLNHAISTYVADDPLYRG